MLRGRAEQDWEWHWGPRAASEVGEQDVARFVADFMVETDQVMDDASNDGKQPSQNPSGDGEENEDEAEARMQASRERKVKAIERAAGGNLAELMYGKSQGLRMGAHVHKTTYSTRDQHGSIS